MEYFLPIAEVYVSIPLIFILSLVVGILSGLFGVGGGFLMTPFLIFLGIPPAYAVPNEANNILGTSISGSTTHYLKGTLDYKMGLMIVVGGVIGTILGILTFSLYFVRANRLDKFESGVLMQYFCNKLGGFTSGRIPIPLCRGLPSKKPTLDSQTSTHGPHKGSIHIL